MSRYLVPNLLSLRHAESLFLKFGFQAFDLSLAVVLVLFGFCKLPSTLFWSTRQSALAHTGLRLLVVVKQSLYSLGGRDFSLCLLKSLSEGRCGFFRRKLLRESRFEYVRFT